MSDTNELYQSLVAAYARPQPPEGAFSVLDLAADMGVSRNVAQTRLEHLEEKGLVQCGVFPVDGYRRRMCWFTPEANLETITQAI